MRRLGETLLPDIVDDPDDVEPVLRLWAIFHRDALPEGILPGPDPPRHGLTDNNDTRVVGVVIFGKLAPAEQTNSHGAEISGAHARLIHKVVSREPPAAFQFEIPPDQILAERPPV